ncbi:MAG: hypothetical protein HYR63_20910 [Proteobacteria bacterium]|nr:hypothetical protein [Pseudomonadota bacterium]MBI3496209.1 hypothetical protein [Pseudomonadota bacterium]
MLQSWQSSVPASIGLRRRLRLALWMFAGVLACPVFAAEPIDPLNRAVEFRRFDPGYDQHRAEHDDRIRLRVAKLAKRERDGVGAFCAHQILREIEWLASSSAHWLRIAERLVDLDIELAHARDFPDMQDQDGAWGNCYTEWFLKLDATYDHIAELSRAGLSPPVPVRILDRVNSPRRLRQHIVELVTSDLARDGIERRRELNETLSALTRLILRDQPIGYEWDERLKTALTGLLLDELRNPATGYWSATYRSGGRLTQTTDLSITFHIVSYLKGQVPDWPQLIDTTLQIKDQRYPRGWLNRDGYMNHHNMDVVEIFRLGWPHASPEQRQAMGREIDRMLDWCLGQSWQPEGSFRMTGYDDSLEASYYFGTSFLARVGFFDQSRRFWTDRELPASEDIKAALQASLQRQIAANAGGEGGFYYRIALAELQR